MRLAELVGSSGSSANDREEIGFAKDSPLEGTGFEISVPRCLVTANSVGAFISAGEWRLLGRRNSSIRLLRPATARVIPPRRLSIGPDLTEASKPLPIRRGIEISNPFPSSGQSVSHRK